jgi:hypothetical protein
VLLVVNKRCGRDCGLGPLARLDGAGEGAGDARGIDIVVVPESRTRVQENWRRRPLIVKVVHPTRLPLTDDSSERSLKGPYCRRPKYGMKRMLRRDLLKISTPYS